MIYFIEKESEKLASNNYPKISSVQCDKECLDGCIGPVKLKIT
jgi:hypothetical protein